jgi:hypothetical protein
MARQRVNGVVDKAGNTYTRAVGPTVIRGVASQSIYYPGSASNVGFGLSTGKNVNGFGTFAYNNTGIATGLKGQWRSRHNQPDKPIVHGNLNGYA